MNLFFFFSSRRRHTIFDCDWSSDVCSSDLSFMALITALVISLLIGPPLIRKLRELQHGGEPIREDTPERHRTKQGTPTMAGIVILVAILARRVRWAKLGNRYGWVVWLPRLAFGSLGGCAGIAT